jgi:hypothetical protein
MENNTIQITPTIIGVVVDEKYTRFIIDEVDFYKGFYLFGATEKGNYVSIEKFDGKYKIHGTSTLPELEFDFEVDESWVRNIGNSTFIFGDAYEDYMDEDWMLETKEDSFRTRIQKAISDAGLLLINPIDIKGQTFSNEHQNKWQESESKVIRGKLLIIEKI